MKLRRLIRRIRRRIYPPIIYSMKPDESLTHALNAVNEKYGGVTSKLPRRGIEIQTPNAPGKAYLTVSTKRRE